MLSFAAACGDNKHGYDHYDAGSDSMGGGSDAAVDAPPDALTCTTPQIKCGGVCVNPTTDNANCGACGAACTGTDTCQTDGTNTKCCPAGQHNCGGTCVDWSNDENHCGSCTTTCNSGDTCDNGTCCGTNTTVCTTSSGQQCFDLNTDEQHCGTCTTTCNSGETCTLRSDNTTPAKCCATGDNNCGGTCSDPKTDNANCGGCGLPCNTGIGETCSNGKCCGAGKVECNGQCVLPGDNATCGATAGTCGADCTATSKVCATQNNSHVCCQSGELNCSGTCSNPLTDNNNCGACGNPCGAGQTCTNGICCGPGETACGNQCVDINTDNTHCGNCGTDCTVNAAAPVCSGGVCAALCGPGETNCSGDCVFPLTDHDNCGTCGHKCAATEVCNAGTCSTMQCPGNTMACGGSCVDVLTDPNHCGNCGNVCPPTDECVNGACQLDCPNGQILCGGQCVNPLNNNAHCSTNPNSCGTACGSGTTCQSGVCCGANEVNCNGVCTNITTAAHCGSCGTACTGSTPQCTTSGGSHICCPSGQVDCISAAFPNGHCVDTTSDEANCGACVSAGGDVCGTGQTCQNSVCCNDPLVNISGLCCLNPATNPGSAVCGTPPACVNTNTDDANCGACGGTGAPDNIHRCDSANNIHCVAGSCTASCPYPPNSCNVCTDTQTDPNHCGSTACATCPTPAACVSGTCQDCATATGNQFPNPCNNACTNFQTDSNNCGACNAPCNGGEACSTGKCCAVGTTHCGNSCVDFQTGEFQSSNGTTLNCGGCGPSFTCAAGSTCTNGQCQCPFGTESCNGSCVATSVDPNNCGACTTPGNNHKCANGEACVSGTCTTTCPAPLTMCNGQCVNLQDDDAHCNACATSCNTASTGKRCSAGACVTPTYPPPPPPTYQAPGKCNGGGPPIIVPVPGQGDVCTGNLGQVAFTFGICSRSSIGPLSQDLLQDAFDSTSGAYASSCTVGNDATCAGLHCAKSLDVCTGTPNTQGSCPSGDVCRYPVKCVGPTGANNGKCIGGGVGVNGTITPVASNTATTDVGGDFWVYGATGLAMKGATTVRGIFVNDNSIDVGKTSIVYGKTYTNGGWTSGGNADMTIKDTLFSKVGCPNPLPSNTLHLQGTPACTSVTDWWKNPGYGAGSTNPQKPAPPCGDTSSPPTDGSLLDIQSIVNHFSNSAFNDNAANTPAIPYSLFDNVTATVRVDLPCGYYYFNQMNIGKDTTVVVHGRTAIFIAGAMRVSQKLILDLDPTATLDIFVGGAVNVSNIVELGSPAFPRRSRLWIGGAGCTGTGSCSVNTDCCSGICTGGFCAAGGGGNLSQAMSLSNGGFFNGLIWSGWGTFTHSNPLTMYGSIYTGYFDASGDTAVHYDVGAQKIGEECPPPSNPTATCDSCRQCGNQPCVNGRCGSGCTSDSQCCQPLHCDQGSGICI